MQGYLPIRRIIETDLAEYLIEGVMKKLLGLIQSGQRENTFPFRKCLGFLSLSPKPFEMNYGIFDLLQLIGSLGVFLFGMKLMSEALQKVAGPKLRRILAAMTSSRLRGILSGILITAVIQSSSATTVMLVSFVNAGLLNLIESIGIIMGANIGTTVTAWIISILGFKVKMSILSLPLIGLSMPLIFSKLEKRRSLGEVVVGFALLFIGLEYLKTSVPDINTNPEILSFLADFTDLGYVSFFLFLLIGTILTIVIQSSSATMALTLVMCSNGWIEFETAAAMVLGENIGTTVTANIAASVANTSAKRAARAHLIFNLFGVIWMAMVFPVFLKAIDWIVIRTGAESAFQGTSSLPIALSLFHTTFNILNVAILIWFAPFIAKTATRFVKNPQEEEEFHLKHINTGILATPELSLLQAKKEIISYSGHIIKMYRLSVELLQEKNQNKFSKKIDKVEKYENISDRTELEIAQYLTEISSSHMSGSGSRSIQAYLNIIDNMESISDSVFNLAKTFKRKAKEKVKFTPLIRTNIKEMFDLVDKAMENMAGMLAAPPHELDLKKANKLENSINKLRNKLRKDRLTNIESQADFSYFAGVLYGDLFAESERLADYIYNVCESVVELD